MTDKGVIHLQIQFENKSIPCLRQTLWQIQNTEQTMEVKLTDGMPDIGRILGTWGQVLMRSKEWRGTGITVSGGAIVWVLYAPEDGSEPRSMEVWVPFQCKWDIADSQEECKLRIALHLRSVDARTLSARKMMVRIGVSAVAEALEEAQVETYEPDEVPDGVELLRHTYPTVLMRETGEKIFQIDDDLALPGSCPEISKLVHYEVVPETQELRVMGGKIVFRGTLRVHILYRTPEEKLFAWDTEAPFSQYDELSREYDADATADVLMGVTSLELEPGEDGVLHLKCGLAAQYVICDRMMLEQIADCYSPYRPVSLITAETPIPSILDKSQKSVTQVQNLPAGEGTPLELAYYPDEPRIVQMPDQVRLELPGAFQMLYYDAEGKLQSAGARCEQTVELPACPECRVQAHFHVMGVPQLQTVGGVQQASVDGLLSIQFTGQEQRVPASGLTVGELAEPDPGRPSLVLRRADGNTSLWEMAKHCGSTVELIRQANHLQQEPEKDRMLLIPVI